MGKKKQPNIFTIELDVYDAQVLVAVGTTKEEVVDFIEKSGHTKPSEGFYEGLQIGEHNQHGRAILDPETCWNLLWLKEKPKTPYDYGILAHEASHLSHFILDNMGVAWDARNDEVVCYTTAFIVKEVLEHLRA